MLGWLTFSTFLLVWVGIATWVHRKGRSKIVTIGGGFIGASLVAGVAGCIAVAVLPDAQHPVSPEVGVWGDEREWCVELQADGVINTNFYPGKHETSKYVMKGLDVTVAVQWGFETREMPMFHLASDRSALYVGSDDTHALHKLNRETCPA